MMHRDSQAWFQRALVGIGLSLCLAQPCLAQWGSPTTRAACGTGCAVTDTFATDATMDVTGLSVAIGDFIGVVIGYNNQFRTISSVVCDTNTLAAAHTQTGATAVVAIYFLRATATCDNVLVTLNAANANAVDVVGVIVVAGTVDPAAETGTSTSANPTGTSATAAAVTPVVNNVLYLGVAITSGAAATPVGDADFTDIAVVDVGGNVYAEYQIRTDGAAQSYTVTAADSEVFDIALAAFEGTNAAAGGGDPTGMLGVIRPGQ